VKWARTSRRGTGARRGGPLWTLWSLGFVRFWPSATWTCLVYDNPFGSDLDRLVTAIGKRILRAVR